MYYAEASVAEIPFSTLAEPPFPNQLSSSEGQPNGNLLIRPHSPKRSSLRALNFLNPVRPHLNKVRRRRQLVQKKGCRYYPSKPQAGQVRSLQGRFGFEMRASKALRKCSCGRALPFSVVIGFHDS